MPPGQSKTVLIPLDFGSASNYDPTIFPVFEANGPLEKGNMYLIATLNELIKIREMSKSGCDYRQLLKGMKAQYDELIVQKNALQMQKISFNPIKLFSKYRKTRLFLMAVRRLYFRSKSTSDQMKRDLLSLASSQDLLGEEDNSGGANQIRGLAIPIEGDLDAETRTLIEEVASILNSKELLDSTSSSTNTAPSYESSSSSSGNRFSSSSSGSSSTSVVNFTIVNTLNQSNATLSRCTVTTSPTEAATINVGCTGSSGAPTVEAPKIPSSSS